MPISKKDVLNHIKCTDYPIPTGHYILVEPLYQIISSKEFIGIVVCVGKSAEVLKAGQYIRYNPNYGTKITFKGKPFYLLIDKHILEGDDYISVIDSLGNLLNDKLCGGDNIVQLVTNKGTQED